MKKLIFIYLRKRKIQEKYLGYFSYKLKFETWGSLWDINEGNGKMAGKN